jgi:hypothetical protein
VKSKVLDIAIANFLHENALPFNTAGLPSLAVLVDQCINFSQQRAGSKYKAPNQHKVGRLLLESAYEHTPASAQPIMDRANFCCKKALQNTGISWVE